MTGPEQHDGQTVAFPVNELTRRLLRRASEPIGVIDVLHAAELHSRASLGVGSRLEFVNNLKQRYGADVSKGLPPEWVAPLHWAAGLSPFNPGLPSAWLGSTGITDSITGNTASPPPQEYRVRRPNSQLEPAAPRLYTSETVAPQSHAKARVGTNAVPIIQAQRRTAETKAPVSSSPNSSLLPLMFSASSSHSPAVPEKLDAVVEIPHTSAAQDLRVVASMQHELSAGSTKSSRSIAPPPKVSESPRSRSASQMHLQRMPDSSAAAKRVGGVSEPDELRPGSTHLDSSPIDASRSNSTLTNLIPRISEVSPPVTVTQMHLQRRVNDVVSSAAADSTTAPEVVTAAPQSNTKLPARRAVAPEIRVASPPAFTSIVWRKADTNGARQESGPPAGAAILTPAYANSYQIMRQSSSEPASSIAVAPPETPIAVGGGAEITRIAEHVSRIIARQLAIERERRGRTK